MASVVHFWQFPSDLQKLYSNLLGYLASLYLEIPSGASSCAGLTMENESSLMPIFQLIKVVFALAIGIIYDILMIQFLQKRKNSIGPCQVKLVPWKSSSSNTSNDNNILVPVSATITTLVGVIGKKHALKYMTSLPQILALFRIFLAFHIVIRCRYYLTLFNTDEKIRLGSCRQIKF